MRFVTRMIIFIAGLFKFGLKKETDVETKSTVTSATVLDEDHDDDAQVHSERYTLW